MIDIQSFILNYINEFSYIGVFLLTAFIALIPLPEELFLLLAGYFSGKGFAELDKVILAAYLGILTGDNILYYLIRKKHYLHGMYTRVVSTKLKKWKKPMKDHTGKSIFLLRFILGLRFLGPLMAGTLKVRWRTFAFFNFLAVLVFVTFYIFLGYYFNNVSDLIIRDVLIMKYLVLGGLLLVIIVPYLVFLKNGFFKRS